MPHTERYRSVRRPRQQHKIWFSSTTSNGSEIADAARDEVSAFHYGNGIVTAAKACGVDLIKELVVASRTVCGQTDIENEEAGGLVVWVAPPRRIEGHVGRRIGHPHVRAVHLPGQIRD